MSTELDKLQAEVEQWKEWNGQACVRAEQAEDEVATAEENYTLALADIERLKRERDQYREAHDDACERNVVLLEEALTALGVDVPEGPDKPDLLAAIDTLKRERDALREALHRISLAANNSGTTSADLRREAKSALESTSGKGASTAK